MRGHSLYALGLLIVLAIAGEPMARAHGSEQAVGFDLYRDYLIVVRGSAGSQKNLNFLLDTGASPTVLDRRLARKLQLDEVPGVLGGINGKVAAGRAIAPSLEIGPRRRDNIPVVIEDLSFFDRALPVRIDAVIGLDMVGQGAFEINYSAREINFGPIPSLKNSLRVQMFDGLPLVEAELDQTPVHLLLDTGASSLILFAPKTPTPASPVRISVVRHSSNMVGEFQGKSLWVRSLKVGQTEFRGEPAMLVSSSIDTTDGFDGLVSPALLGITKVAFDLDHGVVAFSR